MKNIPAALIFTSLLTASSARAQGSDLLFIYRYEDQTTIYAAPQSLKHEGATASLDHIVEWGEPQRDEGIPTYLSTRVTSSYDCTNKLERYESSTSYTGTKGSGKIAQVDEGGESNWETISHDSMEEKLWQLACQPQ